MCRSRAGSWQRADQGLDILYSGIPGTAEAAGADPATQHPQTAGHGAGGVGVHVGEPTSSISDCRLVSWDCGQSSA